MFSNGGCLLKVIEYKKISLVNQNVLYSSYGVDSKVITFAKIHQILKLNLTILSALLSYDPKILQL